MHMKAKYKEFFLIFFYQNKTQHKEKYTNKVYHKGHVIPNGEVELPCWGHTMYILTINAPPPPGPRSQCHPADEA